MSFTIFQFLLGTGKVEQNILEWANNTLRGRRSTLGTCRLWQPAARSQARGQADYPSQLTACCVELPGPLLAGGQRDAGEDLTSCHRDEGAYVKVHIISDLAWCGCSIVIYLLSIKSCRNFNKENRLFFDAPGEYLPTWNMRTEPSSPHCKVPLRRKLSWVEEVAGAGP